MPGGGCALLYASKNLDGVKENLNFDQKIGVDIVQRALQVPLKTIANNAGQPQPCLDPTALSSNHKHCGQHCGSNHYPGWTPSHHNAHGVPLSSNAGQGSQPSDMDPFLSMKIQREV